MSVTIVNASSTLISHPQNNQDVWKQTEIVQFLTDYGNIIRLPAALKLAN